jgi:hypothetical protein
MTLPIDCVITTKRSDVCVTDESSAVNFRNVRQIIINGTFHKNFPGRFFQVADTKIFSFVSMAAPDRATCKARWTALFKQALDADTWGQALEASDFYTE